MREALEMALAALEIYGAQAPAVRQTIAAARKALAQPEQEPICYASINKQGDVCSTLKQRDSWRNAPLYTAPPKRPWVGLTDKELNECVETPYVSRQWANIEAKLKEKNT